MRQYSADRVSVNFTGIDLTPGAAVGTFFAESPPSPLWRVKGNGVGGIVYTYHPPMGGQCTVIMDPLSKQHFQLLTFHNADRVTKSLVGVLRVVDNNTSEVSVYSKCRILGRPPTQKGTRPIPAPWVFGYEYAVVQGFNFDKAAIGA